MTNIRRLHGNGRLSKAVVHDGLVYLTGQVAEDHPGGGAHEQTVEILQRVDALLAEAGSDKTRILKAYLYLADMKHFPEVNAAWDAWVVAGAEPARTTIEARLTSPDYDVELGIIATI
jgi:enamine deaminase RidA (YjgF/YER057c/UK114 family)